MTVSACSSSPPDTDSGTSGEDQLADSAAVWDEASLNLIAFDAGESVPVGYVATDSFEPGIRSVDDLRASVGQAGLTSGCGMAVYYQSDILDELTGVWTGRELSGSTRDQLPAVGELADSSDAARNVYESIASGYETCDETPPTNTGETYKTYLANSVEIDCGDFECVSSRLDISGESSGSIFYASAWYTTVLSGNLVYTIALQGNATSSAPAETDADFQQHVSAHISQLDQALRFAA